MTDTLARLRAALEGRYAVEREAGAGGMATVYLAEDLKHHRKVAIKVLRPELAASIGTDRFLREIEMAARLQHPHILPVYDSGVAGDEGRETRDKGLETRDESSVSGPSSLVSRPSSYLYYVMPFVEGESLRDRLVREKQLPVEESVRLTREAASALAYAHDHGVVHRDIKPENILLFGGHAVVADFGIARALEASGGANLTGMGIAIGTPAYMSPEQATASDEVDGRSDQYSLACVLYEMLAGQQAFSGPTVQSVMTKSISGPRPRVRALRVGVPDGVEGALLRALDTDPAKRFPTMAQFSDALGASLTGGTSAYYRPKRARWIAAAAAVVIAGGAFAAWSASRSSGPVVDAAQRIAVLPFRTSGASVELLGEGMVDLMSTNLDAVGGISTVEPRTVLQRWKKRGESTDLDGALAVGRDVDAGAVLLGSVIATGPTVRLTADLYAADGRKLGHAQVDGAADSVLALVDGLSLALMREVWRSNEPLPSVRVAGLTTASIGAMRSYLQGEQFYRRSAWDSAQLAFGRAVEQDSTFALAQYRLAMTYGWTGNAGSRPASVAAAAAVRYSSRLPVEERSLVNAYRLFQQGREAATDSMLNYTRLHPEDADGWYLLGESQFHTRQRAPRSPAELQAPFDRVLELDSSLTPAAIHPLEVALEQQDSVKFRRYLKVLEEAGAVGELARFRPAGTVVFGNPLEDTAGMGMLLSGNRQDASMSALMGVFRGASTDPDAASRRFKEIIQLAPEGDGNFRNTLRQIDAVTLVGLGKVDEANRLAAGMGEQGFFVRMLPIWGGFDPPGYADSLAASIAKAGIRTPGPAEKNPFPLYFRTLFLLGQGDAAGAEPLIQRGLSMDSTELRNFGGEWVRGLFTAADGWRLLMRGDTAAALRRISAGLDQVGMSGGPGMTAPVRLHRAIAMANRPSTRAEGIRHLRYSFDLDPQYLAVSRYALGEALEAAGDRAGAAEAYGEFIRYWAKADASLQPRVQQARERLALLQKAGG